MSKKGIFGSLLVDPWFIIAFIFILIMFYILFSLSVTKETEEIKGEFENVNDRLMFINFLTLPVGNNLNVFDLFYLYAKDKKEETAKKIISNADFFNGVYCIELYLEDKKIEEYYFNYCSDIVGKEVGSFDFVNFDNKKMTLKLFRSDLDKTCSGLYRPEICESWLGCKWENGCKEI